jgi:ABC-type transporter Mla MlaB component
MSTSVFRTVVPADSGIFSPAEAPPAWRRQAELSELERMLRAAILSTLTDTAPPVTLASAQRADGYAAVVLAGTLDGPAIRAVSAHLRGLLDGGARHLVVDLSRVGQLDPRLHALLRRVEERMATRGGAVELTGLSPRVLHDMEDDPLARVFALYRAALENADARDLSWARMRCPGGLDEAAEPHTAARHRSIIDTRSGDVIPPRWTARRAVPGPRSGP